MFLKDWLGIEEHVGVSIVEGEGHGSAGSPALSQLTYEPR
jgi:hypothetical protein